MSKYRNKKVEYDGITFDSQKEGLRYLELKGLERIGEIKELKLQPRFNFKINNKLMFYYKADFSFINRHDEYVVEDVKSPFTAKLPIFKLKKKIIEATYGFIISIY